MAKKTNGLEEAVGTENAKVAIQKALLCCGNKLSNTLYKAANHDFVIYSPDEIPFADVLESAGCLKSGRLYDDALGDNQKETKVYYITKTGAKLKEEIGPTLNRFHKQPKTLGYKILSEL